MLHLRGTVTEGDNRVRLRYQNPRPFGEQRRMKLIDLLGKNVEDPSVFVITCSLRGHLQHSFQLRKVLDAEVTVEKLAKRFGQHMSRAQDTFSILDKKPTLGYDARDTNTFFVRLPPATILVMEAKAIFFNLLGFAPDQIKRYPKGLVGLGNEGGELITIFAREPCPPNLLVSDLFYSLESCEDLDEEEYEGLGEGNFELAFHSELPEQEVFSQCRVQGVDSPSQLAQVIRPLLRDVEGKLGLFPGILVVEEVDNALSFFVRTAQAPPGGGDAGLQRRSCPSHEHGQGPQPDIARGGKSSRIGSKEGTVCDGGSLQNCHQRAGESVSLALAHHRTASHELCCRGGTHRDAGLRHR